MADGSDETGKHKSRSTRQERPGKHEVIRFAEIDWKAFSAWLEAALQSHYTSDPSRRPERAREGLSIPDIVQSVVESILIAYRNRLDEVVDVDQLRDEALTAATRQWGRIRRAEYRHNRLTEKWSRTLTTREMFEVIVSRHEQAHFFKAWQSSFKNNSPAWRMVYLLVYENIPFHDTQELAPRIPCSVAEARNLKRQIVRAAHKIMKDMQ